MSDIVFAIIGALIGIAMFWKNPTLSTIPKVDSKEEDLQERVSVIIPARNEEANLGHLLEGLTKQKVSPFEIICVDDQSEDRTSEIAKSFGTKLVTVKDKPEGWTGKSWACHMGAENASGELLLFLDADVGLRPDALARLARAYRESLCTVVSVQPYHSVEKCYEQLSIFFNAVGVGANGMCMPFKSKSAGLFGPIILISRESYDVVGGHHSVRTSITDDLALGEHLDEKKIEYRLLLGGDAISVRMYGGGIKQLIEGWSKNYATGALKTSPPMLLVTVIWLGAHIAVPLNLESSALKLGLTQLAIYSAIYIVLAIQLRRISSRIGSFKSWVSILFPIPLTAFIAIFLLSTFKKVFIGKAEWKGRKINLRR